MKNMIKYDKYEYDKIWKINMINMTNGVTL